MREVKKTASARSGGIDLTERFKLLEENLTHVINSLETIKPLKSARKELKRYRTAISAIERQVHLFEKESQR